MGSDYAHLPIAQRNNALVARDDMDTGYCDASLFFVSKAFGRLESVMAKGECLKKLCVSCGGSGRAVTTAGAICHGCDGLGTARANDLVARIHALDSEADFLRGVDASHPALPANRRARAACARLLLKHKTRC